MSEADAGMVDISGMAQTTDGGIGGIQGKGPEVITAPDPKAALAEIASRVGANVQGQSLEAMLSSIATAPEPSDTDEGMTIPMQTDAQPSEANAPKAATVDKEQGAATQSDATVSVPDKFKTKDGGIDAEKVAKSTTNALDALKKYEAIEKELRAKQAEVNRAKMGLPARAEQTNPQTSDAQPQTFEKQLEADIQKFGLGTVMARMFDAAKSAAVDEMRGKVEDVETQIRGSRMRAELEAIAKTDPGILTDEGMTELRAVREANPWVNHSENPWSAAHDLLLAQRMKQGRPLGEVRPTPTGTTAKAPATPIGPTPKAVTSNPKPISKMSKAELNAALDGKDANALKTMLGAHLRAMGSNPGRL